MQSSANLRGLEWLEIAIEAPAEKASELALLLEARRLDGWIVECEEPVLRWVCYMPQESGWEVRWGSLCDALRSQGISVALRNTIVDEDWCEVWKESYHPFKVGQSLVVCPSWEHYEPAAGEKVMVLDPGMAFGSGLHATTSMCMELLEDCRDQGLSLENVLDVGTGSGILTIAALLLGAGHVKAVDSDSVAVKVALENLAINNLSGQAEISENDGPLSGQYDIVLANITADPHIEMAERYAGALKEGGRLIISGIISERGQEVAKAMEAVGLQVDCEMDNGEWVSMCLRHK